MTVPDAVRHPQIGGDDRGGWRPKRRSPAPQIRDCRSPEIGPECCRAGRGRARVRRCTEADGELEQVGLTSSVTGHGRSRCGCRRSRRASPRRARTCARCCAESDREDLVETAVLLVSEVVTNALLHAGTDIDVAATLDDDGLRVEVGDGSPHLPSPPPVRRHRRHRSRPADARVDGRRLGRDPAPRRQDGVVPASPAPSNDLDGPRRAARTTRPALGRRRDNVPWSCATCRCCCTPPGRSTPRRCCGSTCWPASTTRATRPDPDARRRHRRDRRARGARPARRRGDGRPTR